MQFNKSLPIFAPKRERITAMILSDGLRRSERLMWQRNSFQEPAIYQTSDSLDWLLGRKQAKYEA